MAREIKKGTGLQYAECQPRHGAAMERMMRKTLVALAVVVAVALGGCGEQKELVRLWQFGSSQDVWLVGGHTGLSRVVLIFGYVDDMEACNEFARAYMAVYPNITYGCEYAN